MSDQEEEEIAPEDKLYPEYLSVHEYMWNSPEDPDTHFRAMGYLIHQCEECIMLTTILIKKENYYVSGEIVVVPVREVISKLVVRGPVDTRA